MTSVLLIFYLLLSFSIIGVVLLQQGTGAGMGASFGSGASNTFFGASGSGNVLGKVTAVLALIFIAVNLLLAITANRVLKGREPELILPEDALVIGGQETAQLPLLDADSDVPATAEQK